MLSGPALDAILLLMTDRARKLLEEVLGLSTTERAEMAAELLATLPPGPALDEENPDPEWAAEIERRAREAMADPDGGIPWETARGRVDQRQGPPEGLLRRRRVAAQLRPLALRRRPARQGPQAQVAGGGGARHGNQA